MSISSLLLNFHDVMDAEANPLMRTYCSSWGASFDRRNNSIEFFFTFFSSLHVKEKARCPSLLAHPKTITMECGGPLSHKL